MIGHLYPLLILILVVNVSKSRNIESSANSTNGSTKNAETHDVPTKALELFNVSLDFSNVGLTSLPNGFVYSKFLTYLTLDNNLIRTISKDAFEFVPKLSYLSLANNKLRNINLEIFSELMNLRTLNLDGNCGRNDPTMRYGDYKDCWQLTFSSVLPHLTRLYLRNNSLRTLVFLDGKLPVLTHLHLSDNLLQMDDKTWSTLNKFAPGLTNLDLENSGIHEFRVSLMSNVTWLDLGRNKITSICNEYCDKSSLKLKGSSKLETLVVSQNDVSRIEPDAFNDVINLGSLDLSGNKITEIREGSLDNLRQLKQLYLESNELVKINGQILFKRLQNLETLWLGDNLIVDIKEDTFNKLMNLKELRLNNNRISSIDSGTFSNLIHLRELSLAGNWLSTIPTGSMPTSGALTTLDLADNLFDTTQNIAPLNSTGVLSLILQDNPLVNVSSRWLATMKNDLNLVLGNTCYERKQYPVAHESLDV